MNKLEELKQEVRYDFVNNYVTIEMLKDNTPHGMINELADTSVPIPNNDIMELGLLSEVYLHENELPESITPIGTTSTAIYEILQETLWDLWKQIEKIYSEIELYPELEEISGEEIIKHIIVNLSLKYKEVKG